MLHLYRPMIYFTAFSSPRVLDQAFSAITSLIEFGGYDGHIHVITDQDKQLFLDNVPTLAPERLSVQPMAAQDWVGDVAAKYDPAATKYGLGVRREMAMLGLEPPQKESIPSARTS